MLFPITLLAVTLLIVVMLLNLYIILSAERHYRQLPTLATLPIPDANKRWPSVAVIVPARNESAVIERVVCSLTQMEYPAFTVTVVDDQSSDDTAAKARQAGAAVLTLTDAPPLGWTGKCNACEQVVRRTESDWLLFTDADTAHQPDSLRRAVAYAETQRLDALSLLLRQECVTFSEKAVLPMAYQNYFATLDPQFPAFNGQYILIRRAVYETSGGFGAVRSRVMEDVALAEHLRAQGYRIALLNGHDAASVRMYQSFGALWQGMTKTTLAAAKDQGLIGLLLALPFFLGVWTLPLGIVGLLFGLPIVSVLALASIALTGIGLWAWLKRFNVQPRWLFALLNPIGMVIIWGIGLVATTRSVLRLGVQWKGRTIRS